MIEKEILKNVIPNKILNNLDGILLGEKFNLGEYTSKIRIIPFSSLGKENGMLLGINAKSIVVENKEDGDIIKKDNIIIGIHDGILSKSGKYHGLIGLELLEKSENENLIYKK